MSATAALERVARDWVEAYNAGDYARLRELLADDFVLEDVGTGLVRDGADSFVANIKDLAEVAAPGRRVNFDAVHVAGDTLVCEGGWTGTFAVEKWGNAPGTKRTYRACTILHTRAGRITRFVDYACVVPNES